MNPRQIRPRKLILGFAWQFGDTAFGVLKFSKLREYEDWTIGQTSCTIFTWNLSEGQASFDTHKPELFTTFFIMTSVTIDRVFLRQVNLPPKVVRTDAIQSFVTQETILLTLLCSDGIEAGARVG